MYIFIIKVLPILKRVPSKLYIFIIGCKYIIKSLQSTKKQKNIHNNILYITTDRIKQTFLCNILK